MRSVETSHIVHKLSYYSLPQEKRGLLAAICRDNEYGVVNEKRIAEAAIEMSIMTKVLLMAAHEHKKRALTVASEC